jgi:glycosyltransferase involved in cell wall biosynthesis
MLANTHHYGYSMWNFHLRSLLQWGRHVEIASEIHRLLHHDLVLDVGRDKEERLTLLFVGRLKRVKKPDHAIRAFQMVGEMLHDARLWIVGDGYLRDKLERMAEQGVEFMGRVEDSMKVELMTRAHVLLFPAVREGWGLSITEANARGTPAVARQLSWDATALGFTQVCIASCELHRTGLGEARC